MNEHKICFIIGNPRSGTTLIRLILECHPNVSVYDEPISYEHWRNSNSVINEINEKKKEGKNCFVFKVPNLTEQLNNPNHTARFTQMEPFHLEYQNQFLIFMVRDPRDVCLSLKKLKAHPTRGKWINFLPRYLDEVFPQNIPHFEQIYSKELKIIKKSEKFQFSAVAALVWKIRTNAFFEYKKLNYKLHLIFYEDLVTFPETNIQKMCKFLGITFYKNMLRHQDFEHSRTDEGRGVSYTLGMTNVKRPIDPTAVKLFKEKMNQDEQDLILSITGETYKKIRLEGIDNLN